jgi:hypothetical protein
MQMKPQSAQRNTAEEKQRTTQPIAFKYFK